jgi:hypothetical protein
MLPSSLWARNVTTQFDAIEAESFFLGASLPDKADEMLAR